MKEIFTFDFYTVYLQDLRNLIESKDIPNIKIFRQFVLNSSFFI